MAKSTWDKATWTFLTNHAHVLLCLAGNHAMLIKDIARQVGITERAVQQIIADLAEGGYITRTKTGRRNTYKIHRHLRLRHPVESNCRIHGLIHLVRGDGHGA